MNIGFIGAGNMARAIIGGILEGKVVSPAEVHASDPNVSMLAKAAEDFGIETFESNAEVAAWADIVVLAVKPFMMEDAIDSIVDVISLDTTVVSIAAGKTLEWIEQAFGMEMKLVRVMPNTPALVGEGVTGICANERVSEEELQTVIAMFRSVSIVELLLEEPAVQHPHHYGHGPFRPAQRGRGHRRLCRPRAERGALCPLGAERHLPAPFLHPFRIQRQHGHRALDVP